MSQNQDTTSRNVIVSAVFYGLLLPMSFLGMVLSFRMWRKLFLLYGIIFGFAFGYALFIPSIRYRMPIEPLLCLFAAYSPAFLMKRLAGTMDKSQLDDAAGSTPGPGLNRFNSHTANYRS